MTFEESINNLNEFFFFREFTFSKNSFRPNPKDEVQLADNVVWLDNLLFIYQVKERNAPTNTTPERERKWFRNKVLGEAVKQIRTTSQYLQQCATIQLQNGRGHIFDLATACLDAIDKIIVYLPHESLPNDCRRIKHYTSSSAGLIHLIQAADYLGICQTLMTPYEVHEYLQFRKELIERWADKILDVPEPALVGHYLIDGPDLEPDRKHIKYLYDLEKDRKSWDMSGIIRAFADKIFTSNQPHDYYGIISEIAKLNRNELRRFKERFVLAIEKAKTDTFARPYRVVIPRTGCGFLFVPITKDLIPYQMQGLKNLTHAHKYDQKLSKSVGVSISHEGEYFNIYWCYLNSPWRYDSAIDQHLKDNNPFRDVKISQLPRYTFKAT